MGVLLVKVMVMWLIAAVAAGFSLGALIHRAEQIRKDEFLTYVLASIEALQASQS